MFSFRWAFPVALLSIVAALACFFFFICPPAAVADSTVTIHGTVVASSDSSATSATGAAPPPAFMHRPRDDDDKRPTPPQHLPARPKVVLPPGVVARVNDQDITRTELTDRLQMFLADQALIALVQQAAIRQEAKAEGVTATKEELDETENKIYNDPRLYPLSVPLGERKESWLERLKAHGQTLEIFRRDLEVEVLVNKMVQQRIKITDDDVHAAFDKYFGKGSPGQDVKFEDVKAGLTDRLIKERTPVQRKQLLEEIMKKADIKMGDTFPLEQQDTPKKPNTPEKPDMPEKEGK